LEVVHNIESVLTCVSEQVYTKPVYVQSNQ